MRKLSLKRVKGQVWLIISTVAYLVEHLQFQWQCSSSLLVTSYCYVPRESRMVCYLKKSSVLAVFVESRLADVTGAAFTSYNISWYVAPLYHWKYSYVYTLLIWTSVYAVSETSLPWIRRYSETCISQTGIWNSSRFWVNVEAEYGGVETLEAEARD